MSTLDRRIGGVRAGSAGHVYRLTPTARRLLEMQRDQPARLLPSRTPGAPFLNHALVISDIYVSLIENSRNHHFSVTTFTTEPTCWHPTGNNSYLKPDAYLVLTTPTYQDCWWLEIDQATESKHKIKRKIQSYIDHLTTGGTGPDGIPPRILFTTPDVARSDVIDKLATDVGVLTGCPLVTTQGVLRSCARVLRFLGRPWQASYAGGGPARATERKAAI